MPDIICPDSEHRWCEAQSEQDAIAYGRPVGQDLYFWRAFWDERTRRSGLRIFALVAGESEVSGVLIYRPGQRTELFKSPELDTVPASALSALWGSLRVEPPAVTEIGCTPGPARKAARQHNTERKRSPSGNGGQRSLLDCSRSRNDAPAPARWKPPSLLGMARVSGALQPNNFTCGPACVRTIANHLGHPEWMTTELLGQLAGTNSRTGTTETEMSRALSSIGATHTRPRRSDTSELLEALRDEQFLVLRIGAPGFKHWILLHGYDYAANRFLAHCPTRGPIDYTAQELSDLWSYRDYDHFQVGMRSSDHRQLANLNQRRPLFQWTLGELVPARAPIFSSHQVAARPLLVESMQSAADVLERTRQRTPEVIANATEAIGPEDAAFEIRARRTLLCSESVVLAIDRSNRQPVGIIRGGTPFVHPEARGRGAGVAMVRAALEDCEARYLAPSSFSIEGFRTRIAAWRKSVDASIEGGLPVPNLVRTHRFALGYYEQRGQLEVLFPAWKATGEQLAVGQQQSAAPEPDLDEEAPALIPT